MGPGFCGAVCPLAIATDMNSNAPATTERNMLTPFCIRIRLDAFMLVWITALIHPPFSEGPDFFVPRSARLPLSVGVDCTRLDRRLLLR
jgi:hypothetical protein